MRWSVLALCLLLPACGGEPDAPKDADELSYELFPSTLELDATTLEDLELAGSDGSLQFSGTPTALASIEPGQVVLAGHSETTPNGLLRLVTAVEGDSDLVLQTVPAPLELAFRKLHVKLTRTFDRFDPEQGEWDPLTRRTLASGGGEITHPIELPPMDGDGYPDSEGDQLSGGGSISGSFKYVLGLDVDWGEVFNLPETVAECLKNAILLSDCDPTDLLPELIVGYQVTASAHADVAFGGVSYLPFDPTFELEPVFLGLVEMYPLVFTATLELRAGIYGEASSQFSLSQTADIGFEAGVSYSTKDGPSGPTLTFSDDFTVPAADATLTAKSRIEVTPSLHLRLYGVAGPFAELTPWAELNANHEEDPCWRLTVGANAALGLEIVVDIPGIDGLVPFPSWKHPFVIVDEKELLTGSCPPLEGGEVPTSGAAGDPTEAAFADPQFEPWAKSYDGAVVNHAFESVGAQVEWTSQTPTFDGRFLVTGSNLGALMKIDQEGEVIWAKRYEPPEPFNETVLVDNLLPSFALSTSDVATLLVAHPWTLLKIDPSGTLLWTAHFDQPHGEEVYRITAAAPAPEAGFYLLGNYGEDVNLSIESDTVLVRVDAQGNVLWAKRFGSEAEGERGRVLVPFEGGVVAAGSTIGGTPAHWRAFAILFDDTGEITWSKHFESPPCDGTAYDGDTHITAGLVGRDGDLIFGGTIGRAPDATFITKIKPDGSLGWTAADTTIGVFHLGPIATALVELPTSGYLAAGMYNVWEEDSTENEEIWLAALDGVGRVQWMKGYGGTATDKTGQIQRSDTYPSLSLTQDGGALLTAFTQGFGSAQRNLWSLKLPAKSGEIAFDDSAALIRDLPYEADTRYCPTLEDYGVTPIDHEMAQSSLEVTAHDVDITTSQQTP